MYLAFDCLCGMSKLGLISRIEGKREEMNTQMCPVEC